MASPERIRNAAPRGYVALLRVFMGAYYLRLAWMRVSELRVSLDAFKPRVAAFDTGSDFSWLQSWLPRVLEFLRDTPVGLGLWVAAPLLLGVSLVLGFYSRLSAALGALLVAIVWLLRFRASSPAELMPLEMEFAVFVVLCLAAAGRAWGLDGFIRRRRERAFLASLDTGYVPPRIPIVKDVEPIPLSETKPGSKPALPK